MERLQHIADTIRDKAKVAQKRYQENEERIAQEREEYHTSMGLDIDPRARALAGRTLAQKERVARDQERAAQDQQERVRQQRARQQRTQPRQAAQTDWNSLAWLGIAYFGSQYIKNHQTPPKTVHFKDTWNSNPYNHYRR
jgi:hypothetical protein